MSGARLTKAAPTLILIGFLGYAMFSMGSGIPGAAEGQAEVKKGLDLMVQDVLAEGSTAAAKLEGKLRDPFWAATPEPAPKAAAKELPGAPERDELAEIVRGMSLDATFLQGRNQLAVIDGRIYSKGQRVAIPGDDPTSGRSIQVVSVSRMGVLLKGGTRLYHLGYPDQLGKKEQDSGSESAKDRDMTAIESAGQAEMFQRLLNSPLGAMGRGLVGDAVAPRRPTGPATKARGRQGTNPRLPGSGASRP